METKKGTENTTQSIAFSREKSPPCGKKKILVTKKTCCNYFQINNGQIKQNYFVCYYRICFQLFDIKEIT